MSAAPKVSVPSSEEPPEDAAALWPPPSGALAASARFSTSAAFHLFLPIQDADKVSANYLKASFEQFQVEAVKKPTDNARTSTAITI